MPTPNPKILVLNTEEADMLRDAISIQWEIQTENIQLCKDKQGEEIKSLQAFAKMYKRLYKELIYQGVRPLPNHPLSNDSEN